MIVFDEDECRAAGRALHDSYVAAAPFPHIVIDDFLDGAFLRDIARDAFPGETTLREHNKAQHRLKRGFHPATLTHAPARNLFHELNGQAFLGFLEEMTGIEGLIPDPYFSGGGLHETSRGGHLGIHADFNIHARMGLERRLNLLIYLNDDWPPEFGGDLELWNRDMSAAAVRTAPVMGRAVVFSTNLDSFHGHPDPLDCPPERTRRSIATYYYTARREGLDALPQRTTNFQLRPGSGDRVDWGVRLQHLVWDWIPPALRRLGRKRG